MYQVLESIDVHSVQSNCCKRCYNVVLSDVEELRYADVLSGISLEHISSFGQIPF